MLTRIAVSLTLGVALVGLAAATFYRAAAEVWLAQAKGE
jgi:hypothetical protein